MSMQYSPPVSQEDLELVRGVLSPFERGDITPIFRDDAIWAAAQVALTGALTPDFECDFVRDDVGRATFSGLDGLRTAWVDWLTPWESYVAVIEDVIDANEGRVLVLTRDSACPKGANAAEVYFAGAAVWTVRDGKVARVEFYFNRAEGFAAAGLSQ
jgi:ketosteroid isomerase-like protein